jgi:uncharacterized protein (TIGR03086 family)
VDTNEQLIGRADVNDLESILSISNRDRDEIIHAVKDSADAIFTWDYEKGARPALNKLYEKAKTSQWNGETDLPWDTVVDSDFGIGPKWQSADDRWKEEVHVDLLDQFDRSTQWTASKIPAATDQLDGATPCDQWDVRELLDHMIDTQNFFAARARGEEPAFPGKTPPSLIGDDPVAAYDKARQEAVRAHQEPGALEKAGPLLGIALCDQLVHGWDLATATGQDATMPDDLAAAAFAVLDGQLTDERRGSAFKAAVAVPDNASLQDRLLAYTGRQP